MIQQKNWPQDKTSAAYLHVMRLPHEESTNTNYFRSGLNSQGVTTDILRVKQCFPTVLSLDYTLQKFRLQKNSFSFCTMKYSFPKMSILMLKKDKVIGSEL